MLTIKLVRREESSNFKETEDYLKRQQDLDALLILSKLVEPTSEVSTDTKEKVRVKISQLLDKI